jgi:hypothetical protein
MLGWLKRRGSAACVGGETGPEAAESPPERTMSGQYLLLYKYLESRYANTIVLTFAEIENLLGFTLPDAARFHQEWWTDRQNPLGTNYSDAWILARRSAAPNLLAGTVVFKRAV